MSTQTARTNWSRSEIHQCKADGLLTLPDACPTEDLAPNKPVQVARNTAPNEIAATIAPEINQPLMAIMASAGACLRWLAKEDPNLDKARSAAERAIRNGRRAGDLLKSTLALVQKSPAQMLQLNLHEVIAEMLHIMRADLRRNDVSLTTEFAASLGPVIGDRVQLQQVITNLVANGIEPMSRVTDRPRTLHVSTQNEGSRHVLIAILDSGTGVDPTKADRIFEPLFTTKSRGRGLGLSICRSIVEAHGGRLWATPNWPEGSAFRFVLPQRRTSTATKGQQVPRAPPSG
jgi:signal transduction histidine kinase